MLFDQGVFQLPQGATEEDLRSRRNRIRQMLPRFGSAQYAGEGAAHLLAGVMGGAQNRRVDQALQKLRAAEASSEANGGISEVLFGGEPGPSRPETGGAPPKGDGRINNQSALRQRLAQQDAQLGADGSIPRVSDMMGAVRRSPDLMTGSAADFFNGIGVRSGESDALAQVDQMNPQERQSFYRFAMRQFNESWSPDTPVASVLDNWISSSPGGRSGAGDFFGGGLPNNPDASGAFFPEDREFQSTPRKDRDGRIYNQSAPVELPNMNTTQGQVFGYATRAAEANRIINQFEGQGTRGLMRATQIFPDSVEGYLQGPEFEQYLNAERNYLAAVLRRDTGATITDQEFRLYRPMFFPMPGDSDEVVAQKRQMREQAMRALAAGTGPGFSLLPQDVQQLLSPPSLEQHAPGDDPLGLFQ